MGDPGSAAGPHLSPEEAAAYAEGRTPPERRGEVEAHLAGCSACRREVAEVARFLRRGERRGRGWKVAAPLAAAAAILLAVVLALPDGDGSGTDPVLRDGPRGAAEAVATLEVVRPGPEGPGRGEPVVFTWRSAGADVLYRLVVADSAGEPIWEETATDTSAVLPARVELEPGRRYFWYVDAVLADGRSATSGVRELRGGS